MLNLFLFLFSILFPSVSSAYTWRPGDPIVPDCGPDHLCNFCDVVQEVNNFLTVAIWIAVPVSIIVFGWVGWDLIVNGNKAGAVSEAKRKLTSMAWGLFFVLSPWMIVNLLTSTLVDKTFYNSLPNNFRCERQVPPPIPETTTGTETNLEVPAKLEQTKAEGAAQTFKENKINIVSSGNCSEKFSKNCTSTEGMLENTVDGVLNLAEGCRNDGVKCNITITGGTEIGHSNAHSQGKKVDISNKDPEFNEFMNRQVIKASGAKGVVTDVGVKYTDVVYGDKVYTIIKEDDHWDIEVQNSMKNNWKDGVKVNP